MSSQQAIADLKLRALDLKKAGDVEGAKALLAQARDLEFENVSVDDLDDPAALKRLAVSLKKRGDLDGARAALLKAKTLESGGTVAVAAPPSPAPVPVAAPASATPTATAPAVAAPVENVAEKLKTKPVASSDETAPESQLATGDSFVDSTSGDSERQTSRVADGSDDAGESDTEHGTEQGETAFTDEEMLDADMMIEFKQSGMDVPSAEDYQAKILESKKIAIKFKQSGDIENAKAALYRAKMFEAVMTKLSECVESDEELNEEDEAWLMNELNQDDSAMFDDLLGDDDAFNLDDLEDMDAEMLKVMIDAAMEVPTPDEVFESSKEKKALALGLKQAGNLEGAKAALAESKRLQSRAEKLKELLDEITKGGAGEEGIDDLEKLILASENGTKKGQGPKVSKPAAPTKSAEELKKEVLQLRSENKIKEATALFKVYKQAVALESEAAEVEQRKKMVLTISDEIRVVDEQQRLFLFYERFVDSEAGKLQLTKWKEYGRKCAEAIATIEAKGSGSISLERLTKGSGMMHIRNEDVNFVGGAADPADERMEIAIISLLEINENKHFKKMSKQAKKESANGGAGVTLSIRVEVAIHLPPNEHESDQSIHLAFTPSSSSSTSDNRLQYDFGPSQFIPLPRGKSTYAKMIQRRLSRKRVQISVLHVPPSPPKVKSSGWFKPRPKEPGEEEKEPVLLGRVMLELKDFLANNAIAGDFPLTDSGRKELGGVLRFGLRVGAPYDDGSSKKSDDIEDVDKAVDMKPFSPMSLE